jgi:hypothetical protein
VVFVAEDTLMGRAVALKLMPADARRSPEKLQRFLLEAHTAGRLSHPHVVSVYEVDERDGRYYIAMELVRGGSVQDRLDQTGPLDWRDAVRLTAEACRGLAAAHAAGLVHRDIKPDNLLLGAEGSAKIADFGLAKAADLGDLRLTGAGASLCSPQYMSPEQCEGRPVDARTDLYSLGATFHAMLTGGPPYPDARTAPALVYSHCFKPPPDPRQTVPGVPDGCAAVVARAMAKDPDERYPSAAEMLGDLERLLAGDEPYAVLSEERRLPSAAYTVPPGGLSGAVPMTAATGPVSRGALPVPPGLHSRKSGVTRPISGSSSVMVPVSGGGRRRSGGLLLPIGLIAAGVAAMAGIAVLAVRAGSRARPEAAAPQAVAAPPVAATPNPAAETPVEPAGPADPGPIESTEDPVSREFARLMADALAVEQASDGPSPWRYGVRTVHPRTGALNPLVHYRQFATAPAPMWRPGCAYPDPAAGPACLTPVGGHPGAHGTVVVRRWVSPVGGRVEITGRLIHRPAGSGAVAGDGIRATIWGPAGVAGSWAVFAGAAVQTSAAVTVAVRSPLDFGVDADHIPEGDGFVWTVEIRAADGRVWRSAEGFAGPPPLPAKTVETLAGLDDIHRRCADARGARHREFSVQARALADKLRRMFPGRLPVVVDPLFVGRVGGLPPHEQLTAVADELKRLNPDFNGVFDSTTTGGQVVRVVMSTAAVHDVSPLAALKGLQSLSIDGGASGGLVSDLSPIKGLAALTLLTAPNNPVRDLSPPTVLYDWSSAKMNRMLGRVGAARGASAKSGPQRAASAATAAQPVRVGLLLMVSGIRPGPGAVNVL